jgi:hypothetical protein
MGLDFNLLYKGGSYPSATSTQSRSFKQLTPENIQFLLQIGLRPKTNHGHLRHWG